MISVQCNHYQEAAMEKAKLFEAGRNQAVQLPEEFRFSGKEVNIQKVGEGVLLTPIHNDPWALFDAALAMFEPGFVIDRGDQGIQDREDIL